MNEVVIYYGTRYGHITKIQTLYRKRHILKEHYLTKCGRSTIIKYENGNKRRRFEWVEGMKEAWDDVGIEDCKICFKED